MSIQTLVNHNRNHLSDVSRGASFAVLAAPIPIVGPIIAALAGIIGGVTGVLASQESAPQIPVAAPAPANPQVRVIKGGGYERSGPPAKVTLPHTVNHTPVYLAAAIVGAAVIYRLKTRG